MQIKNPIVPNETSYEISLIQNEEYVKNWIDDNKSKLIEDGCFVSFEGCCFLRDKIMVIIRKKYGRWIGEHMYEAYYFKILIRIAQQTNIGCVFEQWINHGVCELFQANIDFEMEHKSWELANQKSSDDLV